MIKLINFLLTIVLAFVLAQFLPWWGIMVAALFVSIVVPLRGAPAFLIPLLAVALLWMVHAWWLGNGNDFTLSQKLATLLPLSGSIALLILITGVVGGLAAGFAGLLGSQFRALFAKK